MSKRPRPRPRLHSLPIAALLGAMALVACKQDGGPGSASIDYLLGNDKTCAEVGVETIHVVLSRGVGADRVEFAEEYAACDNTPVIVSDIDPNLYDLLVEGLDANMIATFDNLKTLETDRKLEIFEDSLAEVPVEMTARPADLLVRWDFGFTNCMGTGIDHFRVRAFEVGGGNLMLEYEVDCATTGDQPGGYRLVPDPDRVLNGTQLGEVGVLPLDASGTMIGEQVSFVFDPVGPGYPVKLTLDCNDVGCTSTGMTD